MCCDGKWAGSFICREAVSSTREGSDQDLERTLLKPSPSWTVLVKQGISYYYGKNLRPKFCKNLKCETVIKCKNCTVVRTLNVKTVTNVKTITSVNKISAFNI